MHEREGMQLGFTTDPIEGKRIETIEVSLRTLEVVQSRGVCNKNTEYHEQIVNLVNANRGLISRRMKATA